MRVEASELWQAWEVIRHGGKAPGPDGVTPADFRLREAREIDRLVRELCTGRYTPGVYRAVAVPKGSSGTRILAVSNVRDRVVQRVLLERIGPIIEARARDSSFAYRPGRCHLDALERMGQLRAAGFAHVVHADVRACFDEINLLLAAVLLRDAGVDEELVQLIVECLSAGFVGIQRPDDCRGLPQGAVLSPLTCNLVLTEFDRAIEGRHRRLVRFADDFVILCQSGRTCERMLERARHALGDVGLAINERKTEITSFDRGFRFLGARLAGSLIVPEKAPPYGCARPCRTGGKQRRRLEWVF